MKKTQKKLYCILNELGYDFKTFKRGKNNRIIFQKLVYSMQRNGFNLGYDYNLYINGPYSPALASDGYSMVEHLTELERDEEAFNLSEIGREKVNRVREYIDNEINDSDWLETLTTLDYLKNEVFCVDTTKEEIYARFDYIKPHLSGEIERMDRAWDKIMQVQ